MVILKTKKEKSISRALSFLLNPLKRYNPSSTVNGKKADFCTLEGLQIHNSDFFKGQKWCHHLLNIY